MKKKKVSLRRCVGCREMKDKRELIRIVKKKEGVISIDETGKMNGRGAYLCRNFECYKQARKMKSLNREFKANVPEKIFEDLEKMLGGNL